MLVPDCLVFDLIFRADVNLDPTVLADALGGEEAMARCKILDPDMQDPRFEMELSPSIPFRRRGERRLMIIDEETGPLRPDPHGSAVTTRDLRTEKENLIKLCETGLTRLGRLFALGSWGDAVLVAEDARDLRAICLLHWVLDPTIDVDGKKRAGRLAPKEFEEKVVAYEKRIEELTEEDILEDVGPASFARRGNYLVVDVLEADGTWDQRKSLEMEHALAAVDRFSIIPGAPASARARAAGSDEEEQKEVAQQEPAGPPLQAVELGGTVVLVFPRERFDLDIAAAIGKKDWDTVLTTGDLNGEQRDQVFRNGAEFVAPLEFLSEVFVDGLPLSKPHFEQHAQTVGTARVLDVHCPRFGPALLIALPPKDGQNRRFISSMRAASGALVELLS